MSTDNPRTNQRIIDAQAPQSEVAFRAATEGAVAAGERMRRTLDRAAAQRLEAAKQRALRTQIRTERTPAYEETVASQGYDPRTDTRLDYRYVR